MEMIVSQIASTQQQTQSTASGQASKSAGGAEFQKTLVQQINGEAASGTGNTQGVQLVANVSKEGTVEAEIAAAPALSDLMSIIDGLLAQLEAPEAEDVEAQVVDEQQSKQLEAVLDQMNALLALLGIPVPVIQQTNVQLQVENGSMSVQEAAVNISNVKSSLQDTLLQLQAMLQQGTSKMIQQQEPTVLIAEQLKALTAILEGETVDTNKQQTKSSAFTQQLFALQNAPQAEVSTLLQRLSQQSVHPALFSTAVQSMEQAVNAETAVSPIEPNVQLQLGTSQSETLRGLAPLAANAAATAASFVVADDFAKSMTGMIVQKFDMTTLNGVSEAKIMLFPEHLGQVDVRITMQNGLLTAIFQTDTAMAKDMLDNQMAQLRSALQAQGLMVDKLEVSQGQSAAQLSQQHQGQGSREQQSSSRHTFIGDEGTGEAQFETEMIEQAAIQGLGFGRGINVRA
ncbi:flagellar hook-length control protein FliK [Paenibacillus sp. PL91]|uniref:flagellar hook-length control protein FliK n=1 Tax=Paenibacillus sp. PL91 TaxID=2729538 RepID=UPI00145EB8AB|nr:flagellar hook-length control protein FliK [Paenibacillus sp. PL91]MBC9199570.1 flagellar hook-length control protein FliK [Paenibacillus sp. PL91]